jgi:glycosyltransferase involved in cell wall biosynthesis
MLRHVSVITVCYNSAATIATALRSVELQTWPDIEHIVIDGGSTDGTQEVIARHGSRVAHLSSERDDGIYDAMNKGLVRATGDVICFLNADDAYAHAGVIGEVVARLNERKLDALYGDVVFFSPTDPTRVIRRYRSGRFTPDRLAWGWMPAHPALFMTAAVYRRVGLFDTSYRLAGDYEYVIRAMGSSRLRAEHFNEVLVRMQVGGISTSGWRSKVLLNREVLRACRSNGIRTNLLRILSKYPLKTLELLLRR